MFKRTALRVLFLTAGLISAQANAAFVSTDWKSQGDAKATLDTETGIEWLDLNLTTGKSIIDVKQLIKEGGSLFGWRLPTTNEVESLMLRFFPEWNLTPGETSGIERATTNGYTMPEGLNFSNLFSLSVQLNFADSFAQWSMGMYSDNDGNTYSAGWFRQHFYANSNVRNSVGIHYPRSGESYRDRAYGVFLVSDGGTTLSSINNPMLNVKNPNAPVNQVAADVPVHAGFGVLGLIFMALGLIKRKSF